MGSGHAPRFMEVGLAALTPGTQRLDITFLVLVGRLSVELYLTLCTLLVGRGTLWYLCASCRKRLSESKISPQQGYLIWQSRTVTSSYSNSTGYSPPLLEYLKPTL